MIREKLEAHADACYKALISGREIPQWSGGSLAMADLSGAELVCATLIGADLSGAHLNRANLVDADLSGADLTGARLANASLIGTNFSGASLFGADLSGARLFFANLSGADLSGARLDGGVACGRAISEVTGGYRWWAIRLEDGDVILAYGCRRHPLDWWLAQGPELSQRHGHPPEHWAEGPAVAIAAAVELSQTLPAGVRR